MDKRQQNIYIAQKIFCKINNHDAINEQRFKRRLIEIVSYTRSINTAHSIQLNNLFELCCIMKLGKLLLGLNHNYVA